MSDLDKINAKYIDEVVSKIDMGPDDFIFAPESMMMLMNWTEEELQEAINDGRVALINWEGGGQSVCTPNSVWLK
jgi:hypothetical protein